MCLRLPMHWANIFRRGRRGNLKNTVSKTFTTALDMKIYPIFLILLSACATAPDGPKVWRSLSNIIFNYHGAGNIVSNCRNSSVGSNKTAEIVCFETSPVRDSNRETFEKLEQKLRASGWITPEPYMVSNARNRVPDDVSDEDFFVLKLEGTDKCNYSSVTVFIDEVFSDIDNQPRMLISLNKLHHACDVLI